MRGVFIPTGVTETDARWGALVGLEEVALKDEKINHSDADEHSAVEGESVGATHPRYCAPTSLGEVLNIYRKVDLALW